MPVVVLGNLAIETLAFCVAAKNQPIEALVTGFVKGCSLNGVSLNGLTYISLGMAEQIGFLVEEDTRKHAVKILNGIKETLDQSTKAWLKRICRSKADNEGSNAKV